jgi:hypothetical protein
LRAEAQHHDALSIAEQEGGNRSALDAALEIITLTSDRPVAGVLDVPTAGATDTLEQPIRRISRDRQRHLWATNAGGPADGSETHRIFDPRDGVGIVAEQRPARADARQQIGAIFEPAAADDARAVAPGSEGIQRADELSILTPKAELDANVSIRRSQRVLIPETVRNQRHIAAASRRCGQRPTRGGGDQHRSPPIH